LDAHNRGLSFHVHVLDSPIEGKGKQLLETLCSRGIKCSYGMLASIGYVIRECQLVLLGCSAILSHGCAVAERGTSQVALVASASNIPVLVAAQTCKFVDRVQSFLHGVHEVSALVGERQEAVPAELITALVTELRILPPSSAPAVLKAKQLAVDS
uniref:Translation initiation factor eIF2B subunit delta n=1 Tax=Gongylonema pulchrum TaxID=637853 RepID=A0A183E6A6_9BILA